MIKIKLIKETKQNLIDRSTKLDKKYKKENGEWTEEEQKIMIYPKPCTKKMFYKQKPERIIGEREYIEELKQCR